jgi:competence protein ComEA
MPTPAERKALLFLAGVVVLGASVRVVRAARGDDYSDPATRAALARQLSAVDSAHGSEATTRKKRGGSGGVRRRSRATPTGDSAHALSGPPATHASPAVVDLDVAPESAIETLPRIGPVLARRIVEDRSAKGPFGSLEGFQRVRGVGPVLARQLENRVTFSGTARPSNAVVSPRLSTPSPSSKSPRRERRNERQGRPGS